MNDDIREIVRQKYARVITGQTSCCGTDGKEAAQTITGGLYGREETAGLPKELLATSLGCGNPTALTSLHAGEVVLDLGSGAGLDVLLSARRVGPYGKAYGLDMTAEMLAVARANQAKAGIGNAEFLRGYIEEIPLAENTVDVVISNCVLNLSADKDKVLAEIFRVLKPGGRLAVSDIVTTKPLPERVRNCLTDWAGCAAGALTDQEYLTKLTAVGFQSIELIPTRVYDLTGPAAAPMLSTLTPEELNQINGSIVSAFVRAKKPARLLAVDKDFNIKAAVTDDFPRIHELLAGSGLPTAGVNAADGRYYVASAGELLGVVGVEGYGSAAMLRSLAVTPAFRKTGVADSLVKHALGELRQSGFSDVYLLTITAEEYLTRHGFGKVERREVPGQVLSTSVLGSACCPSTSTCMHRKL